MLLTRPKKTASKVYDLSRIDGSETLRLWRERQPNEPRGFYGRETISRAEAARRLGMDLNVYARIEGRNTRTMMSIEDAAGIAQTIGTIDPTRGELCFLARRRSGAKLNDICDALGVSRPTYYGMEALGDPRVVAYWESRGFVFPEAGDGLDGGDGRRAAQL